MKVIAKHATIDGYSVAIIRRDPRSSYEIVRVNPDGKFITWDFATYRDTARAMANKLWLRDMGRETMIGGAPAL